ncbi:MAG: cytochrome C oxidase subunit IV family protein [Acidobacteriota bacterium]|nr:cytochrome C oxidase subunit IV family protein [Acidobacteriota bacterium]
MSVHIVPRKLYFMVFGGLMLGTLLTVIAANVDFGAVLGPSFRVLNDVVALTIAVSKALLVILFFMHVRYSSKLTMLIVVAGFFWLGIMIVLTMSDYLSRGMIGGFPK